MDKIVIVGGGSAGWMTATHLQHNFPEKEITVIESPNFPTIGVGESTLQQFRLWTYSVCLDDADWMPHCDASYKVSIKFNNWDGEGNSFHYPFGPCYFNDGMEPAWWALYQKDNLVHGHEFASFFFPAELQAEKKKMVAEMDGWNYKKNSAYHFDAIKFANWLKTERCIPRGVKLIEDTVEKIYTEGNQITYLSLESGEVITADLFVDCTGFKALLMSELDNEFKDYSWALPNNKAWCCQIDTGEVPEEIHTDCTTLKNGWVWRVPTASRVGTGYVYSDKYTTDEEALEEFKEYLGRDDLNFRNVPMKVGRQDKLIVGNVATIGLSYGFMEPLESNGLFTTHMNLFNLEKAIRSGWSHAVTQATNKLCGRAFDEFATFVYMHYSFAKRNDTKYWKEVGSVDFDIEPANEKIITDALQFEYIDMNASNGLMCVAMGNGFNPTCQLEPVLHSLFTGQNVKQQAYDSFKRIVKRREDWKDFIDNAEKVPRSL